MLAGLEARGVLNAQQRIFRGFAIHAAVVAEMVVAEVAATSEGRLLR